MSHVACPPAESPLVTTWNFSKGLVMVHTKEAGTLHTQYIAVKILTLHLVLKKLVTKQQVKFIISIRTNFSIAMEEKHHRILFAIIGSWIIGLRKF
jgi:hypothetical protein